MNQVEQIFIARYSAKKLNTHDLVNFSDEMLSKGVYSENFVEILDAELKAWEPISSLFDMALKSIGYNKPDFNEAIWILTKYHVEIIATGKVDVVEEFSQLLEDISRFDLHKNITHYVGDSIGIAHLYGLYHSNYSFKSEIHGEMVSESKKWLEFYAKQQH